MFFVMNSSLPLILITIIQEHEEGCGRPLERAVNQEISLLRKKVASSGCNHDLGLWTLLCVEHRISRTGGFDLCPYPALLSGREFL